MHGVLVIDKSSGPTSFDVVRQVRTLLRVKKAGHTGTLDPMATGVLPICLGEATKVAGLITEGNKAYEAVIGLGQETDTYDAEGKVVAEAPVPPLTRDRLEAALQPFRGEYQQVPPMFSAVKVGGKRLYELARAGEEIERRARPVVVYALVLRDFAANELRVSISCSKGFFVRSLAHELGRALGCGGHLKALRRTRSGPFTLEQALPLERLAAMVAEGAEGLKELERRLIPIGEALAELPAVQVSAADAHRVTHGVPVEVHAPGGGPVRVLDPDGRCLAVADVERGRLKYRRVLA